jgi:hypothetical protein
MRLWGACVFFQPSPAEQMRRNSAAKRVLVWLPRAVQVHTLVRVPVPFAQVFGFFPSDVTHAHQEQCRTAHHLLSPAVAAPTVEQQQGM